MLACLLMRFIQLVWTANSTERSMCELGDFQNIQVQTITFAGTRIQFMFFCISVRSVFFYVHSLMILCLTSVSLLPFFVRSVTWTVFYFPQRICSWNEHKSTSPSDGMNSLIHFLPWFKLNEQSSGASSWVIFFFGLRFANGNGDGTICLSWNFRCVFDKIFTAI